MSAPTTDLFIELHVPDFQKAIDFYTILEFEVLWQKDGYLVMKRGQSIINFYKGTDDVYNHHYFKQYPKNTKRGYAVELILLVEDVQSYFEKIKNKITIVAPLQERPWGQKDFRIEDPFGFYIRISERYDWITQPNS